MSNKQKQDWLKDAIFYEIYPQSFNDTNNDGIGDIRGIIEKLDYIESLGANAIWLNPCFESPFIDAGYDVADYYKVAPRYGTNEELKELFDKARERGIRIILDLVPGHTSTECEWFKKSAEHNKSAYDDWFIWTEDTFADTANMGFIGGYCERNGQYLTNFFYCQPALNYGFSNPDPDYPWQISPDAPGPMAVKKEIKNIIIFWLDMGASGFRVDMAASLVKRNSITKDELKGAPETVLFWQEIRGMLDKNYPEAVLVSEWFRPDEALPAGFHLDFAEHTFILGLRRLLGLGEEKALGERLSGGKKTKNSLLSADFPTTPNELLEQFTKMLDSTDNLGNLALFTGNHDIARVKQDNMTDQQLETYFAMLLTLPGVPFIYYGDEIGMRYIEKLPSVEGGYGRCGARTPMQWNNKENAGFSGAKSEKLYLPIDPDKARPDVESQEKDNNSLLNKVKMLNSVRKNTRDLQADADFIQLKLEDSSGIIAFSRGENTICIFNLENKSGSTKLPDIITGAYKVLASTDGCSIEVEENKLFSKMEPRSYMIIAY